MADAKITALTELADPAVADLLPVVDDVAGTPTTKKVTLQNVSDLIAVTSPNNNNSLARQAIINGNFDVWQRGTDFTAATTFTNDDDSYFADCWNLISDGDDIADISVQDAGGVTPGSRYYVKFEVQSAKRFGIVQIIESRDAIKFKDKYVSVSFKVQSTNISAVRCAVLSWGSTADSVTSDVVSSWAATPTWATNWTSENTPADITVTSDWTTVKVENIYIDSATVNNLALVIWTPNEETASDSIRINQIQLNEGSIALPYQPKSFDQELEACKRYVQKSYEYTTNPGTSTSAGGFQHQTGVDSTGPRTRLTIRFEKEFINDPTTFMYWDYIGNLSKITTYAGDTVTNNASINSLTAASNKTIGLTHTSSSGVAFQYFASAEL